MTMSGMSNSTPATSSSSSSSSTAHMMVPTLCPPSLPGQRLRTNQPPARLRRAHLHLDLPGLGRRKRLRSSKLKHGADLSGLALD